MSVADAGVGIVICDGADMNVDVVVVVVFCCYCCWFCCCVLSLLLWVRVLLWLS